MVPKLEYQYELALECIDENGAADVVRVFVCRCLCTTPPFAHTEHTTKVFIVLNTLTHTPSPTSSMPSISAIVNMPMSELLEKE